MVSVHLCVSCRVIIDVNDKINTTEYGLCEKFRLVASVINDEVERNWVT